METVEPASLPAAINRLQARWVANDARMAALPQTRDCPKHGQNCAKLDYKLTRLIPVTSNSLADTGEVYTCDECVTDQKLAAANKRRIERLTNAGVPTDTLHATLENFSTTRPNVAPIHHSPTKFLNAAIAFHEQRVRNLILCGTPGIGKGHLAAALMILAFDTGKSIEWVECCKLFRAIHSAYGRNETDPDEIIYRLCRVDLLVLDELGLRDLPADGEEIIFTILDARHKAGRQTILLGNKTATQVKTWLGSRISDRLRSGDVIFCYGEWDSMRGSDADGAGWLDADELPNPHSLLISARCSLHRAFYPLPAST